MSINNQIHETYPLSSVQKGMLFHSLEQSNNGVYLQQFICNLNEYINIEAFEQAWQKIIERHTVLRTGFQWQDVDEPQQIVYQQVNCPLHFEDWSDISNPDHQLANYLESDKKQGFDLSEAPLIRLALFKFSDNDYRFIWTHHHIILDGRSYFILFKELFKIYKTYNENTELKLSKVYPYSEYIEWLQQQDFSKSEQFWRKSLNGVEAPTPLIKSVESVVEEQAYLEKTYDLSETLTEGLVFFAEQNGLTLNTLVQAAWAILLSRYSSEDKVIFGATRACRHWTKIEPNNRVGIFINTVPFCTQLDANMDVLTWLDSLRSHWVEMREHEHTPLTQIKQWSDISADSSLFDSVVVFENADLNSILRAQGEDWQKRDFSLLQTTNYPLLLTANIANNCLHLMLQYETARFETSIINRMFGHLEAILTNIIANPTQRLSEVSLLTQAEQDQLLIEWNNTAADYPLDKCVHQLFEEQVEKTPDAIAVKFENQQLTYSQLNARANQVAHHLLSLNVKPDSLIGLSVERSLEMIVGMLGILKASAAYVPLDPAYPEERLNFILEDSGIEILLDKERLTQLDQQSVENPSTAVQPNNLAYVIYTSGSTGKPKGVLIEHKSLVNHNFAIIDEYKLTPKDKLLQFASFNFDVATEEIFPTLLSGATLVLWKAERANAISDFISFIAQQQLTVLNLPAQYWHTWVLDFTNNNQTLPTCLRLVIAGSETVPLETVTKWHKVAPNIDLRNAYGPTESTITATTYKTELLLDDANSVPIGKPIANTQIYILDKNQEIVPQGVPGELHIGGVGLARGYLNRPELTAEKFIYLFNKRLYKTGDLVRYLPNSNIEFLGRIDNQVKIRGFRIELGEIESVLMQHSDVNEAAVIVREDQPGDKRLVAYIVGSTTDLRKFMKAELPNYMVPSAFVSLEKMPLTPSGKIDRRALPAPTDVDSEVRNDFIAPRNQLEQKVAEVWQQVLGVNSISVHDNFFDLGGHSLLATQVVSRLSVTQRDLFEYPTVAELAERIAEQTETKETVIIPRSDQHDVVSFAQQRLWFIDQLEPNTSLYNIPAVFKITGNLNIAKLQKTLNTIVERHEIIRTILKNVDGKPAAVVLNEVSVDLPAFKVNEQAEIQNLINEEAARPFDISKDLMLRATLLEVNSNEFILILVMHHIASDGWSFGVLFDEFVAIYQGNTLPELAIQYSDFAVWQRQWLSDKVLNKQLSYWKQQLDGMPTTLELATDRSRPAVQTTNGKTSHLILPASLTKALKTLSQQQTTTLFMTLLGAFQILLHRYTNQDDIVVGSPIAGRNNAEIEDLIGFFVNTLVLRSNINRDSSFVEFLHHVREVALGAYAHQDVPFEKLVEELQPERDTSRHPLFQVMFVLQNAPLQDLELPDLTISPLLADTGTAMFDLSLDIEEQANSDLIASFQYNTDLFDDTTIERMMTHFQTLLENIVTNPKQSISELQILTQAEKDQLIIEWNNTTADYALDKCVHQLFEQQVEKTPDAIAVKFDNQQLTYSELNERANQLAHHLQTLGVKADVMVGLCTERSIEMVIGIFGILKAGGAYIPLDPNYPEERLTYMLTNSQADVLLTQEKLLSELANLNTTIICLDADWQLVAQQNSDNPNVELNKDNLAYIIYTSGSTGKPKGVMIPHQAISNHMQWMQDSFPLSETDKVLQKTPFSFDASVWEFYASLLTGGQLIVAKPFGHQDSSYLIETINKEQVTILQATPSLLQMLVDNEQFKTCTSLKRVFAGGEALSVELKNRILNTLNANLINLYGPTEACIDSTSWQCEAEQNTMSIGKPVANMQAYILDKSGQIVPIGVAGELHLTGVGLARGYLNRPELTAEKFISLFNKRLYKTGDLVRYLASGDIEYLGRIDNQVKIRGFRIELGEIESVLMQHSDVNEAAVIVREDQPGDKRLVAYIVGSTTDLRKFMKAELPNYMVPSAFVSLEKMPLTPSGKIDRRALPAPTDVDSEVRNDFIAPRNQLEQKVAEVWQQVLGVNSISVHDNFFDLGGHSLLATQVVSRLSVTQRDLFEYPTVAELAERIAEQTETKETVIIPRSDQHDVVSFAQQRLWFIDQLEPNTSLYNIPAVFKITGNLNIAKLQKTLNTIVERHEIIRTILKNVDGKPAAVVLNEVSVDLPAFKVNEQAEIQNLINEEAARPFDISKDLMLRATLLEVNSNEFILILVMHHIASDGWSFGVLFDEFVAIYQGNTLPELAIQYSDFAVWQRQWLSDKVLDEQLSYWKQQLDGMPTLELATDKSRPATQTTNGKTLNLVLPASLGKALKILSQQQGVTLFMTLLGAFQVLLHRYTNQDDIVVGSPIAGRNQPELENLIGFFVNTLVLRSQINRNSNFIEFLKHVRDVSLGAYAHQDVPFEKLVEELQPERDSSRHPLFQVMFALQNTPMQDLQLADLSISLLLADTGTAKFDLLLDMVEEANSELTASFEYNTDLFDEATIKRMMTHFQILLENIVANPKQSISELEILTQAEKDQLLIEWNNTAADYALDKTVHQLFEEQVEKTPNAIAVKFDNQQLTYSELNERANQLANHLQTLGVKADVMVGLCIERSIEMVIGLLGILKAGGAYIPLDPDYPEERLSYMLTDSQAPVLLTQEKLINQLVNLNTTIICLDKDWQQIAQQNSDNLNVEVHKENLAYIIYTSGSTGKPKGVMIPHQAISNHMQWMISHFGLCETDKVLQKTPFSFDASVWEFYAALLAGGQLIMAKPLGHKDSNYLIKIINKEQVSILHVTPVLLQMLVENPDFKTCKSITGVFSGGEALSIELKNRFFETLNTNLYNVYGPTESTITSTSYKVELDNYNSVPIGRPLSNLKTYILDKDQSVVPIGVPGELHLGGAGLARGYLNRPELTAEKFISHSLYQRIYKTGDLVRYLASGDIEYLGRIDNQIKLRGFRIEIDEIESVILQHSDVNEVAVIIREDQPGDKRLVAYTVNSSTVATDELRKFVQAKLPNFMVPSAFVSLEKMPLTPSMKIDRRALPAPMDVESEIRNEFTAPRDQLEQKIAEVWQKVLNIKSISVHDNFFDLGGHSLLAITLLSKIEKAFDKTISVIKLFQAPTIAQFADILRDKDHKPTWRALLPIQTQGDHKPLFFIGSTDYARLLVPSLGNDQPIYGLNMFGLHEEGDTNPSLTVETMAAEYLQEIRSVQPEGPYHLCGYCADAKVAFEMAQQLKKQGQEVAYLGFIDVVWYADSSLSLNQRASKFRKNFAKFGANFITHKIKSKLKVRKEAKVLSESEQEKQKYERSGESLPLELQHQFLIKTFFNALDNYKPDNYSGDLNLLLSSELMSDWEVDKGFAEQINSLVTGTVTVEEVPGYHDTIFAEPQISVLGKLIRSQLEGLN